MNSIPRPEYPRPDFERDHWMNLNGLWDFEFDDTDTGIRDAWFRRQELQTRILVPFCYQSEKSGIGDTGNHPVVWYHRTVTLPESMKGKRVFIRFGAVDYRASLWVNGHHAGDHTGGHVPFSFDISPWMTEGENHLTLRAQDSLECVQPRGKQYWKIKPEACFYTATTGIWQTVWLEAVGEQTLTRVMITPDLDHATATFQIFLEKQPVAAELELLVTFQGETIRHMVSNLVNRISVIPVQVAHEAMRNEVHVWEPDRPELYDVVLTLRQNGVVTDAVKTYFGMRKISAEGDQILLNNRRLYQRLVLDQGYWPDTLLTPPSDEAIRFDVEMTKKMGFNGARKHQKIEDPRYYYWADKLGLLVWGEMPAAYDFNSEATANILAELQDFVHRDYNHPSIIMWVPFNESWGVAEVFSDREQQNLVRTSYYLLKSIDPTRLISSNDGWEQVDSDICAIHEYEAWDAGFTPRYTDKERVMSGAPNTNQMLYARGSKYQGQPVLVTEYGGIAFESQDKENWGYSAAVTTEADFFHRYADITGAIRRVKWMSGYCYTQLTDVMQEINGLMTPERKLKVSLEKIAEVNRL